MNITNILLYEYTIIYCIW